MSVNVQDDKSLQLQKSIKQIIDAIADGRYSMAGFELGHVNSQCEQQLPRDVYLQVEAVISTAMVALEDREVADGASDSKS